MPSALVQKRICGSMLSPYRAVSIAPREATVKAYPPLVVSLSSHERKLPLAT